MAEPRDFTKAWARLSEQSAHCFALVWETQHLRKLNQSLLAFLASAARPSRSLGTEILKSIPSLVLERGTHPRYLHVFAVQSLPVQAQPVPARLSGQRGAPRLCSLVPMQDRLLGSSLHALQRPLLPSGGV